MSGNSAACRRRLPLFRTTRTAPPTIPCTAPLGVPHGASPAVAPVVRPATPAAIVVAVVLAIALAGCTDAATDHPTASEPPRTASAKRSLAQHPPGPTGPARGLVAGRMQPPLVRVPKFASGRYAVAPGDARPPAGSAGKRIRYLVEVERGLPFHAAAFAADVHRILNDPRGWGHGGRMRFERTDDGPVRVRVALSSPDFTDELCLPLHTGGELSCWDGPRSVINAKRWGQGARTYGRDLASYREYVINHEVGHQLFGPDHADCPARGKPAPVMVQQTKSLYGCHPNPWPFPDR